MSNTLIVGDCVKELPNLPERSVNLFVADPPYNIGVGYDKHDDKMSPAEYYKWTASWLQGVKSTMTAAGSFWLFINDENVSEIDVLAKSMGFLKRAHVIWHYTFGVHCEQKLNRSHTHILHFTLIDDPKLLTFNKAAIAVPSMRQLKYNDKRAAKGGKTPDATWILNPAYLPNGFNPDGDTWAVSRVCGTFKQKQKTPNQLPEALIGRIVRLASNPGDFVCDPFLGSGTTAVVAKKLGRKFIGFDISQDYVDASKIRVDNVSEGDLLIGEEKKAK